MPSAQPLVPDHEQQAAIEAKEPAIAVLAGPGSGKTLVLSRRARHLLNGNQSKALLLTFTNKAAAEMKARAIGAAAVTSDRIWAGTFHAFAVSLLTAHGSLVGLGEGFEILDESDRRDLVTALVADTGVKDEYGAWSSSRVRHATPRSESVAAFGEAYQARKLADGVVDFDDLVVFAAELLSDHDDVAKAYGMRYSHLLVDEFQDTNAAQFAIITALGAHAKTISVFADDDQAIYRFAGAESENIRRFIAALHAAEYPLTVNYRCRDAIVKRANLLLDADPKASLRRMTAHYPDGSVEVRVYATAVEEAADVADEVQRDLDSGAAAPADIAILVRSAFRAAAIVSEISRRQLPATSWLAASYEEPARRSIRTCLYVLRSELTKRQARSLHELLELPASEELAPAKILEPHKSRPEIRELLTARDFAWQGRPVTDVLLRINLALTAIDPDLEQALTSVYVAVETFQTVDASFGLEHFLAELALGGAGGAPTAAGGVKVATLHRTKGLQWPRVYLLGLEEGRMPDHHAVTDDGISDERRTCFVGICRAESRLILTRTQSYAGRHLAPSRFLDEMQVT